MKKYFIFSESNLKEITTHDIMNSSQIDKTLNKLQKKESVIRIIGRRCMIRKA